MTIKFGADTTGFKKGTDEMISKLKDLNKELVNNQYKQKDCNKIISDAQKELNNIRKSIKEKGQADAEQEKRIKELTETIEEQKVNLSQLRTEQISIRQAISSTSSEVAKSNQDWTVLKGTLANFAGEVLHDLAQKLLEVGKNVISVGEVFTASMSEVQAISGASAEDMERLEETARKYGSTTQFTASEAAQALKYMALAGWDTDESIAALGGVLDLAAAGGMDLARASDIVTDYITAFGMSAKDSSEFVDIMAYAMAHSNTNVEQLGEAYKNCAATAASMGFSVKDVTAVLMTMANAGVKGGEAGTTLNTILTRLATDTKSCATELEQFGVRIYDDSGNLQSLSSILEGVSGAFSTLNQEQQANLSKMIAGTNQYSGFQTIMQGLSESAKETGSSFGDYAEQLENVNGTSKDMAKTMNDNLAGDIKTMQSAFEELGLKIYEGAENPLRGLVQTITKLGVPALENIVKNLDKIIPVIVAAVTAMGTFKASIKITQIVDNLKKSLEGYSLQTKIATIATEGLNAAQKANVFALIVTGIMTVVSAFGTYSAMTQTATNKTDELMQSLASAEESAINIKAEAESEAFLIGQLGNKYDELRNKTSLNAYEKKQLTAISEQLAEKLGITVGELKDESGAYRDLSKEIDNTTKKLIEQAEQEAKQSVLKSAMETKIKAEEEYYKKIEKLKNLNNESFSSPDDMLNFFEELNDLKNAYDGASNAVEFYTEKFNESADSEADVAQSNENAKLTASGAAAAFGTLSGEVGKTAKEIDGLSDSEEGLDDKLTAANKELYENQAAIRDLKKQAEELKKKLNNVDLDDADLGELYSEYKNEYGDLINKIAELQTEQTKIRNNIQSIKNEIKSAAKAEEDAFNQTVSDMSDTISMLEKVENEVKDNGSISLSTLGSIIKKYPELTSLVNDYIAGIADEKQIIEGLKDVYNNDVNNYNSAVALKKLKQGEYNSDMAAANAELINKYKEHYGIDLQNFASTAAAKAAVEEELNNKLLKARSDYNDLLDDYDVGIENGQRYVLVKTGPGDNDWERANAQQVAEYDRLMKKASSGLLDADNNFRNFVENDGADFVKQLTNDLTSLYSGVSADSVMKLYGSGSSGSSGSTGGSSTSDKTTKTKEKSVWTMNHSGVYAEGSTAVDAELNWLDRMVNLGKLNTRQQISQLEYWKKVTEMNADERYEIEKRLYDLKKELGEQEQKQIAERQKQAEERQKANIEKAEAAFEKLTNDRIAQENKKAEAAEASADRQIAAIDAVLKKHNEENEDKARQDELNKINAQLKYAQLDDISRKELLRKKQDLLNEQYEVNYQRNMENKKESIQQQLEAKQASIQKTIDSLQNNLDTFMLRAARIAGTQTAAQQVVNNNQKQNIQIVQNALNNDQVVNKLLKALYTG